MGRLLPVLTLLSLSPASIRADLFYFEKGGQVQATARDDGERILIETPDQTYEFRGEDFRKRVPGFVPGQEWAGRRRQALPGGFGARYEALWWAIENGLATEAVAEIRELHKLDPNHAPTARMAAALDRLARPASDRDFAAFRQALGAPMELAHGAHVVLLHQETEAEASAQIDLLERVITSFYVSFAAEGLELEVPRRRLIFARFADQKSYLAFLRTQNAGAFSTTRGYYHPTWNAVVTYDGRDSDSQRIGREDAQARRDELRRFREIVDRLPARGKLRVTLTGEPARTLNRSDALALADRLEREIHRKELLLDLDRSAIDDGTAAHEMVHLLAANSGLRPRHDAFPVWLQEGIAMQFEVVRGGRWAGIGRANDLRLPDWRAIQPAPDLESLVRDVGYGRGYQQQRYAQAWALVYYLRSRRSTEFLKFLDLLRGPDENSLGQSSAERWLATFRRSFGADLSTVEQDWHEFMSSVQTPLERHAPAAKSPSPRSRTVKSKARDRPPGGVIPN